MALLQISEPGESPAPHQRKLAVGIDLGTTNSLVAAVRSSVAEVLPDAQGHVLLPSAVRYFPGGKVTTGREPLAQQAEDPLNTVVSVKRFMGRSLEEARATRAPYEFVDAPGMVRIRTAQGDLSPVEVSAQILAVLRQRAEDVLGDDLVGAVITVPAYFDDAQRQATRDAARLAGLNVLRLDHVVTAAGATDLTHADRRGLLMAARAAREALSDAQDATLKLTLANGQVIDHTLTRAQFEALAQPLVQRTLDSARRALRDAALKPADVRGVVMVGGATRMPVVRAAVGEMFGAEPLTDLDPDQVVALGAALQANLLAGNRAPGEDWLLLDVTPLSLGLETMGGLVERVIPRNSTIPVARAQEFTTFKDGQTAMSIHVLQGERDLVTDCRSLARFELRGIPPMVAGAARIRVTFQVDADGLLSVTAREQSTGVEAAVSVKPSYGLSDDEVARMLADSVAQADNDARARMLREQQVEARQLVESVQAALAVDGDLLNAEERQRVDECLQAATRAQEAQDVDAVKASVEALSAATDEFAARRMDRSIRAALAGRKLDEIA